MRPHAIDPQFKTIRVILCYKAYIKNPNVSHIGLGVAALNTCAELRSRGIWTEVQPLNDAQDLENVLAKTANDPVPISHVVISAPWIFTALLQGAVSRFPSVQFACTTHSNVGFLGADPTSMRLIREYTDVQRQCSNFSLAANSRRFTGWFLRAYGLTPMYLPNLYHLKDSSNQRPAYRGGVLRIGSFGAVRTLKNHTTAAAAALEISRRLGVDTEFWMNSGRIEGGSHAANIIETVKQMFYGIPNATFKQSAWSSWAEFRRVIRSMNLLLQPSHTESFNMVTADGVAEGVPSVVSDAIEWVPEAWTAKGDDALDIANVGVALLNDPVASSEGRDALLQHNQQGLSAWIKFLMPVIQPIIVP